MYLDLKNINFLCVQWSLNSPTKQLTMVAKGIALEAW